MTGATPRLLISDDDRDLRETLGELFLRRGMEVVYAEDGDQTIDVISRLPVHVVLLDLNMPKRSGLEVLEHVRTIDPAPSNRLRPACILMSAQLDDAVVRRAIAADAFRVQSKPFSIRQIQALVVLALQDFHGMGRDN